MATIMRNIRKYSIVFLCFKLIIQLCSLVETEARSLNKMDYNFRRSQRNGVMSMDDLAHTDNTLFKVARHNSILPTLKKSDSSKRLSEVPQSFQDYLSAVLEAESHHKSRGMPKHSRQRRSKIKFIIKKILLFFKLLTKYFFFVAKKTAIIVG